MANCAGTLGLWKRHLNIQNEILDIYKNLFARIYMFSPSTEVDYQTWRALKDYIEKEMGLNIQMKNLCISVSMTQHH